jgi:hypothetical protein
MIMEINIKINDTIDIKINKIKLNEEESVNSITKMDYCALYVQQEMSKGLSNFQATVKFLMDERVPQEYKELYRKKQNQMVEAMDIDEYPEPPKTKYTHSKSKY